MRPQKFCYENVTKFTEHVDLFNMEKIVIPIHKPGHWTMAVVKVKEHSIDYYDSLGNQEDDIPLVSYEKFFEIINK